MPFDASFGIASRERVTSPSLLAPALWKLTFCGDWGPLVNIHNMTRLVRLFDSDTIVLDSITAVTEPDKRSQIYVDHPSLPTLEPRVQFPRAAA
ncbi:hypothetical protein JVT61DRAFT_2580 [Boletus reticuloceps]|uniref:Uncharacterized protein n=1 Tax=Boletus reticuloceps TaxID=495285 RepID=A0A8I2YPF4_9AGAM|nr:hypothetical protein JVT61DRAFT_2580 [Boletus reticuloceps]